MPLLYDIPAHLMELIASNKASLFGAIIKDNASGQILGHVQQSSFLQHALGTLPGVGDLITGFSPPHILSAVQNEQIRRGIAELQNGMVLIQNLQYGALALSGLGLGVAVAGFAAILGKLKAIEKEIRRLSSAIEQVTKDRRQDELQMIFADVTSGLQFIETLPERKDPARGIENLQLSLLQSLGRIEMHFQREADVASLLSIESRRIDLLCALIAAMRLCQDALLQSAFWADELRVARRVAHSQLERMTGLLQSICPDTLSRLASRGEANLNAARKRRLEALTQARILEDGLKGAVLSLAGQAGIAETLIADGISGPEYMKAALNQTDRPLAFLPAKAWAATAT